MRPLSIIIGFAMILLCAATAIAQSPETLYAEKQYAKALEAYKQLEQKEGSSAALYYNMGNCCRHLDDKASAVLYYRKALELDPYLSEAQNNLSYLRHKVADLNQVEMREKKGTMAPEEPSLFQRLHNTIAVDNSSNMWAWCAAACFILFALAVMLYVIPSNVLLKKIGFFGGLTVLVLCVIFIIFAVMASSPSRYGEVAIIKEKSVKLQSGPSTEAKESSTPITEGTELQVREKRTDVNGTNWLLLHLNSDNEGWVKEEETLIDN